MKTGFLSAINLKYIGCFALIGISYVVVARAGLYVNAGTPFIAFLYPSAGIAVAALMLGGYRYIPAITLGAFFVYFSVGASPFTALGIAVGNTLAPVAGIYLLHRSGAPFDPRFARVRSVIAFIGLVAFVSTLVNATIGVGALWLSGTVGSAVVGQTWLIWWVGNALGVLILTPFLLNWLTLPYTGKTASDIVERIIQLVFLLGINIYIFWDSQSLPLAFLASLPLMWIVLRSGPSTVTLGIFTTVALAVSGTLLGHGPFGILPMSTGTIVLDVFSGITAVVFLLFSAAVQERRDAQHTLEEHVVELERALHKISSEDEAKSEFIAILAHELRNPLAAILSSAELIKIQGVNAPDTPTLLETISERVRTTASILDDLLDISRISQKKFNLQKEVLLLRPIIDQSARAAQVLMSVRKHTFSVKQPDEELWLEADPVRLGQIIINLLSNAAKYTDPGGSVDLAVAREGTMVALHVRDTGVGIPKHMLMRIFEPFFQIERGKRTSEGLGIGLSLTQKLVEMHGGTIQAKSEGKGRGSEFIVRMPLSAYVQKPSAAGTEIRSKHRPMRRAKHAKRILVVDDNEAAAAALGRLLSMRGHQIVLAYTGREAIEKARQFRPRVIILDIQLPDINGYEVARQLRQEKGTPYVIIALTGFGQAHDKDEAMLAGFDRHLTKPVGLKEIETILQKVK